jgi:hypothetical protein
MYFSYVGDFFVFTLLYFVFQSTDVAAMPFQAHVEQSQYRPSGAADENASRAAYPLGAGSFTLLYAR